MTNNKITERHKYESDGASEDPCCYICRNGYICRNEKSEAIHYSEDEVPGLLAQVAALSAENLRLAEQSGPYFVRDMARAVGLPDDADINAVGNAIREQAADLEAAEREHEDCRDELSDCVIKLAEVSSRLAQVTTALEKLITEWLEYAREQRDKGPSRDEVAGEFYCQQRAMVATECAHELTAALALSAPKNTE